MRGSSNRSHTISFATLGGVSFAFAMLGALSVSPAHAQSSDAAARALFVEGVALADRGDWPAAIERFERALALHDAPSIRYNMAQSLVHLGRFTEALAQLDSLDVGGPASADIARGASSLRAEIEPRIGRITVRVRGDMGVDCSVEVGSTVLAAAELGEPMPIDPGTRRVRLVCGRTIVDDVTVSIPEGGSSHVVLALIDAPVTPAPVDDAIEAASATPPDTAAPAAGSSDDTWIWVVVGLLVVGAVAGATVGIVVATTPAPTEGNFLPGRLEFGP